MASITKRGNSYRITVSNGRRSDGSQIVETATYTPEKGMTKRQIEKALREFAVDFERDVKSGQDYKGRKMNLEALSELYLNDTKPLDALPPEERREGQEESLMALSVTTWFFYKATLEQRILPRIGHLKIHDITAKTLKDYSAELRKDGARLDGKPGGLSENTIRKDCAIISSMLSYSVGEGFMDINPIIYSGRQKTHKKAAKEYKVDYFTINQAKCLLRAMDEPIRIKHKAHDQTDDTGKVYHVPLYTQKWQLSLKWRAFFYMALFVGDRRGENISFTWQDINFETGEVNIDESTAYVDGRIIHKDTKTEKSRSVYIPPVVIEVLKQWKKKQKEECIKLGSAWIGYRGDEFDKNYVFTQENGKQMHPSSPYHQFKRIIKIYNENVAGNESEKIPESLTQHDLRHTAASIMISNNMDPRSVAGVLGHANASTTLNIYSYFFRSKIKEAASIMSNALIDTKK